jgi:NADPH:quinone reductase-like Zn-dependent oxidoreductase
MGGCDVIVHVHGAVSARQRIQAYKKAVIIAIVETLEFRFVRFTMKYPSLTVLLCQLALPIASAADTMKAIVIVDGKPQMETVAKPEPRSGQVRIEVRAVSVNPVDWKIAAHAPAEGHVIAGRDLAGVIDSVGPSAGQWRPGDKVIAVASGGSYAQYVLAAANAVAVKPTHMSFVEAAGIPIVGETAWRSLVVVANLQPGQRVLIHGGAGGVGSSAVQVAKARGAYVVATASPSHTAWLRFLGADEVIDYHSVRFEDKVSNMDVVLNTVDAETNSRSIAVIKPGGILVSVVGPPPADACKVARIRCAIPGPVSGAMLGFLSDLANQGKFHIEIERRFQLADAAEAWEVSREGHTAGKIILEVSPR